jgi:hypothetical protein
MVFCSGGLWNLSDLSGQAFRLRQKPTALAVGYWQIRKITLRFNLASDKLHRTVDSCQRGPGAD